MSYFPFVCFHYSSLTCFHFNNKLFLIFSDLNLTESPNDGSEMKKVSPINNDNVPIINSHEGQYDKFHIHIFYLTIYFYFYLSD